MQNNEIKHKNKILWPIKEAETTTSLATERVL